MDLGFNFDWDLHLGFALGLNQDFDWDLDFGSELNLDLHWCLAFKWNLNLGALQACVGTCSMTPLFAERAEGRKGG